MASGSGHAGSHQITAGEKSIARHLRVASNTAQTGETVAIVATRTTGYVVIESCASVGKVSVLSRVKSVFLVRCLVINSDELINSFIQV